MKVLIPILFAGLLTFSAQAQEGFRAGIKGGPQSTWMLNNDDSGDDDWLFVHTIRPVFGVSLGYNFSPGFGLQLDALYSMQGQKFTFNGQDGDRQLTYLKVPLLINLNSGSDATTFGYLNVGPQIGFLLSATIDQEIPFFTLTDYSVLGAYQSINIGAVLAFGAGFNLTDFLQLTTGIRVDFAFTDAENKDSLAYILFPNREPTYNATGALEIGLRYVLRTGE